MAKPTDKELAQLAAYVLDREAVDEGYWMPRVGYCLNGRPIPSALVEKAIEKQLEKGNAKTNG
jgi:hypothetical protein